MLLGAVLNPWTSSIALAAQITVNVAEDSDDGACDALGTGTDCTLREAIQLASGNGVPDTITAGGQRVERSGMLWG